MRIAFIFSLLLTTLFLNAQTIESYNIPLTIDNTKINAWVGGLDAPQYSKVDLNNDGTEDLYIFDRIGFVNLTFLNINNTYVYAPEYAANFPDLKYFALLRDYNGDGIQDIFTHAKTDSYVDGIIAYKGKYVDGKIAFDRINFWQMSQNVIATPLSGGLYTNVYVPNSDIPDVNDIDGDGDLDILSFDVSGAHLVYYQNQSVELGYSKDSLSLFSKEDNCWGKFYEASMSEEVSLSSDPSDCSNGFTGDGASERHAGSTTTTYDMDNDGDKEVFLGDLINPYVFMLTNGGTSENAWMTEQQNDFPNNSESVNLPDFAGTFILDLDFDGVNDFIAAPNSNNSPNYNCSWFYKNTGTNEIPNFVIQEKDFIVNTMMDLGSGSIPTLADVTGDGLMDLVVGTSGYNLDAGMRDPRLFLFTNTGSADAPQFTLTNDNWLNFAQYGSQSGAEATWAFAPNFGDIDNDGDLDLVVGEYKGSLFFAENTGGAANPMEFNSVQVKWKNLDVGQNSVPQIVDLDRDGLPDLVVGERNGNINFLKNIGTATEPNFAENENDTPNINFTGQVDAALSGEGFGHAAPYFVDSNGEWTLYLGTRSQGILVYDNVNPTDLTAAFNLVDSSVSTVREGTRTAAVLADLNGDYQLELLIGNMRGGIGAYKTNITTSIENTTLINEIKLFPNPANNYLKIQLKGLQETVNYTIYNTSGLTLKRGICFDEINHLDVSALPSGIYFIKIGNKVDKFVKQ